MLVKNLIAKVRSGYGDEDPANYLFTDNILRDTKIPAGIGRLNMEYPQRFVITGTGDDAIISPEPAANEITLICLYTVLAILDGEISKNAQRALVITDPAGRTDMTGIVAGLREQRKNIREELDREIKKADIYGASGESEVSENAF
jgi:hypothetical protein